MFWKVAFISSLKIIIITILIIIVIIIIFILIVIVIIAGSESGSGKGFRAMLCGCVSKGPRVAHAAADVRPPADAVRV